MPQAASKAARTKKNPGKPGQGSKTTAGFKNYSGAHLAEHINITSSNTDMLETA